MTESEHLMEFSQSSVVRIYQKMSKEGTVVNQQQGHGQSEGWLVMSGPTDKLL